MQSWILQLKKTSSEKRVRNSGASKMKSLYLNQSKPNNNSKQMLRIVKINLQIHKMQHKTCSEKEKIPF